MDLDAEYNNRARVPEHAELIAGWARDAEAYRRQAKADLGLGYGPGERTRLDLFHPPRPTKGAPIVLFIHGGYWQAFDGATFSHMAAGANAHGLTVAVPSYDLCPNTTVAAIIDELRSCCLWLWQQQKRRIVACGHSAGGHLAAAMVATDWTRHGAPAGLVPAGLAVSGLFDLRPLLPTYVNKLLRLDEAAARAASPLFWPAPAGRALEAWVGAAESDEYRRQSRSIVASWGGAGVAVRYAEVAGANHFTVIAPLAEPASEMTRSLVRLGRDAAARP